MSGSGPAALVGREAEVGVLRAAVAAASAGEACAVLLAGEAGVGKTRLVRALREQVVPADALVLGAQCVDVGDPGLPYLVVTDLLRAVRTRGEGDPAVAAALGRAAVLTGLDDPRGARGPVDAPGDDGSTRLRVLDAATTLLADLGRLAGPVVVTVEDLQWVDASSAAFLTFLIGRSTTQRLLVVATVRTDGLAAHPRARALVGELGRLPTVRRLDLEPFDEGEVARYLDLVGVAASGDPDRPDPDRVGTAGRVAAEVFRRTGGNPYFVTTLAADVARTGGLGDGVPRGLADVLVGRLERLPDPVRTVVRCASVGTQPVPDRVLRRAAGVGAALDEASLDDALRLAVAEGLLVPAGAGYAFPHDLLRAAVHDDLLPGERARLHAAYASALGSGAAGAPVPAAVAHHAVEAGDPATVLVWSVRAAEDAMRLPAPHEALEHLGRALSAWPTAGDEARAGLTEGRLAVRASRAAGLAGEPGRAVELGRRAVALCDAEGDAPGGVEARAELARRLVEVDATDEAVGPAEDAVHLAEEGGVEAPLAALAEVVLARSLLGARRPAEARPRAEAALEAARAAAVPGLEADAVTTLAFLDEIAGDRAAAAVRLGTALRLARTAREPLAELRAHYALASLRYYNGDVTASLPVLRTAMARVAESGLRWSGPGVEIRVLHAVVRYVSGDLEGSLRATEAPEGPPPDVAAARLAAVGCYAAVAGGSPDARRRVAGLRGSWDADPQVALVAGGCEADLLTWEGDPEAAVEVVERAQTHLDAVAGEGAYGGLWLSALALAALADLASTCRRRRDVAGADDAVRRAGLLRERVERIASGGHGRPGDLGPEGRAWYVRALAEHARALDRPAVEEWERALEAFGYGHVPEQARCHWRLAAALVHAGDRDGARAHAREAAATAARIGAAPLERAVGALVSRERLAAPGAALDAVLTEREREVLALVAEGLTNREIGARLFISAKTASVHLSNLMAKLNVSSRTEAVTVAQRRGLLDVV
ncbi:helix-turn-helix transcriptional regulator [Fodinibacter luteus]|uniref:Helix-turn-helix transcriptional regulator n=1 Tax=Fodinibacter luteus TaxID=552064 RepID=A0ABP8K6T8_9MICO